MERKRKPTDVVQLQVRLRESLRASLADRARHRGAPLNSEIVCLLERSLWLEDLLKARLISMRGPAAKPAEPA